MNEITLQEAINKLTTIQNEIEYDIMLIENNPECREQDEYFAPIIAEKQKRVDALNKAISLIIKEMN